MKNKQKYLEMMTALSDRFEKTWSDTMLKTVWASMKRYNNDQCIAAMSDIFLKCRFWSNILPDLVEYLETHSKPSVELDASVQASIVLGAISDRGCDGRPKFKDRVTAHLMRTVWPFNSWVRTLKESDVKWWRKDFVSEYIKLSERGEQILIENAELKKIPVIFKRIDRKNREVLE